MSKELILVHGKPLSGKSTASRLAAELLGETYHFSMGDELRARAFGQKPSRYAAELQGHAEALKQALPVPPELATKVVEECIETSPFDRIIIDGYPQYPDRLPSFQQTIERVGGTVLAVCLIDVADDVARRRAPGRAQRAADVIEDDAYINRRLEGFRKNVVPVLDTLSSQYPLYVVDGDQAPDEVASELASVIKGL